MERLLDVTGPGEEIFLMRFHREILFSVLCTGIALAGSALARAQDATSGTVHEQPQPIEPTPIRNPEKRTSKPTLEVSAETPSQKPAPVAEQTPPAEELATPAATPEKKTRVKRRATSAAQPKPAGFPTPGLTSMSAAKAIAVSAPLPEYPYQAMRANITGSGVCVMTVDAASGKVTSAMMAQSTGNAILDKVTTDSFLRWRFKPGTVLQVRVPITYE
jgi:TonB family protein